MAFCAAESPRTTNVFTQSESCWRISHTINQMEDAMVKRAIALGGGGPAAGLHIGVLEALANADIGFDVWALSCIGAWVGIVYNQFDAIENKARAEKTYQFFKHGVFRDDEGYKRFPINTVFGPDWGGSISRALTSFVIDPENYQHLWDPSSMVNAVSDSVSLWFPQQKFTIPDDGDVN